MGYFHDLPVCQSDGDSDLSSREVHMGEDDFAVVRCQSFVN